MEEISEKIRLLYVLFTRCMEKMIVVTSINHDSYKYNKLVPDNVKLKYRSFLDIFNSLDLDKYIVKKDYVIDNNYDKVKVKDIENDSREIISEKLIDLGYNKENKNRYSKVSNKLRTREEINNMEYGTKLHELMEYDINNKYFEKLRDSEMFTKKTMEALKVTKAELHKRHKEFYKEMQIKSFEHKNFNDYKRHFYDWLKKMIQDGKRNAKNKRNSTGRGTKDKAKPENSGGTQSIPQAAGKATDTRGEAQEGYGEIGASASDNPLSRAKIRKAETDD